MSALFGSNAPKNTTPDYAGLQIQTAVSTLPVPIIWGMARAAPNLIWYQNFQVHPGGSGGGGGKGAFFSSGNQQTSYSADVILALCEGQIVSVNNIWRGQSLYTLGQLGLALFAGSNPQGVWNYLASRYPGQALAYQSTAYLAAANYQLTTSA